MASDRDPLAIVKEQAEDEGLWFRATTSSEAYLQAALRRLHAAVESSPREEALKWVLDRAEYLVGYEHGDEAAYCFTQAWSELPAALSSFAPTHAPTRQEAPIPALTYPISLNEAQERSVKEWAADDRLWTTQDTVEVNLRTFARVILRDTKLDAVRAQPRADTSVPMRREATWAPTAANVNALPDPVRRYVHDLETRCDPCGDMRELALTRDENQQLRAKVAMARDPRD